MTASPRNPEPHPDWKAIAAMAMNRAIGMGNRIPWHLPEDFRWFKQTTLGHTLVMGRRTFESIGRALPGRRTVVLSRAGFHHDEVITIPSLDLLPTLPPQGIVFICGGAQIYRQALPSCAELLLTRVKTSVEGDAFLPPFEHLFEPVEILRDTPEFTIERWRNLQLRPKGSGSTTAAATSGPTSEQPQTPGSAPTARPLSSPDTPEDSPSARP